MMRLTQDKKPTFVSEWRISASDNRFKTFSLVGRDARIPGECSFVAELRTLDTALRSSCME